MQRADLGDHLVVPAGDALDPEEIVRPEIFDTSGVEWHHLHSPMFAVCSESVANRIGDSVNGFARVARDHA